MGHRSDIGGRSFTYAQFREATRLTKREADGWVQSGVIQAGPADGHRREYRFESIFEGIIAKQLADFSSRELLPKTMAALRAFFARKRVSPAKLSANPEGSHQLVKIYTRKSLELLSGGGVRGVISYVEWYEPASKEIAKAIYVVVDLTLIMLEAVTAIAYFTPS
jgi:hypothetical protein